MHFLTRIVHIVLLSVSLLLGQDAYEKYRLESAKFHEQGDYENALLSIKKAYKINPTAGYIEGDLGTAYLYNNQLSEAKYHLMQALDKDKTDVNAYYNLACISFRENQDEIGLKYLELSFYFGYTDYEWLMSDTDLQNIRDDDRFKLLQKKYYSKKDLKAIELFKKGNEYFEKEEDISAAKYYVKAAKKEEQTEYINQAWVANLYQTAGEVYESVDKHKKSINCYEASVPYIESLNNIDDLANIHTLIGRQYSEINDYPKAIENCLKAMKLYKSFNDSTSIGYLAVLIGVHYYSQDNSSYGKSGIVDSVAKYYKIANTYGYWDSDKKLYDIDIIGYLVIYYLYNVQTIGVDELLYWSELGFNLADKHGREDDKALFSMTVGFPIALIIPDRALPFLLHSYDYLKGNEEASKEFGVEGGLALRYALYMVYSSLGDLDKTLHYLKDGVQFADNKGSELPIANYMRGNFSYYDDRKTDSKNYYNKVIESVDLNNHMENWLATTALSELAALQIIDGDLDKATETVETALELSDKHHIIKGREQALYIAVLIGIYGDNVDIADIALDELINLYENQGLISESYANEQFDNVLVFYEWSILTKLLKDEFIDAAKKLEASKNRSLKEKFNVAPTYWDFTANMDEDECIVVIEEINSSNNMLYKNAASKTGLFDSVIPKDESGFDLLFTYYIDNNDKPFYQIKNKETSGIFTENYSTPKVLAKVYLNELKNSWRKDWNDDQLDDLSNKLYGYLIQDFEEDIAGKTRLILIPDPIYSNIPLETLKDQDGRYLVEKFDISYVQSYTVLSLLQQREYGGSGNRLLAIGNPSYESVSYNAITYDEAEFASVFRSGAVEYAVNDIYGTFGYSNWTPLPGSLDEINNISAQIQNSRSITGLDANESNIKSLSENGELLNYNIIHFATHGVIMPDIPDISALVLSQNENNMDGEDGYLTVGEVSELTIRADLVNLSACETGLGKVYAGEGVVGLTSAFMAAGANGVCVSLWPVDDQSTSIFMSSFYEKLADGESYYHALSNVKRDFIAGEYGEEYKKPYYWAPFVYYGP